MRGTKAKELWQLVRWMETQQEKPWKEWERKQIYRRVKKAYTRGQL
jgi:hypothetical protein